MSFRHQPKAARNLRRLLKPRMRLLTEFILSGVEGFGVTWPPIFVGRGALMYSGHDRFFGLRPQNDTLAARFGGPTFEWMKQVKITRMWC